MSTPGLSQTTLLPTMLPNDVVERYELEEFINTIDSRNERLIAFLQHDLAIAPSSIAMALRYSLQDRGPLPMVLWRYGFVSLAQLNQIFDWLERDA